MVGVFLLVFIQVFYIVKTVDMSLKMSMDDLHAWGMAKDYVMGLLETSIGEADKTEIPPKSPQDVLLKIVEGNCLEDGRYYMDIGSSLCIPATCEECFEYIKQSKMKLTCNFDVKIASEKFGAAVIINLPENA